jgi:ABC-2 type transport system permease protein
MRSMVALIQREYLEHRGAFLYAPLGLLAIFTLAITSALAFNKVRLPHEIGAPSALKFYELAFAFTGGLWFVYLLVALLFYYADAFSADRRNNAMFFWKSMPLTDFKVLSSKMLAGMTIFPALIFLALLATGVVLYFQTMLALVLMPRLAVPGVLDVIWSSLQIGFFGLVYLALALLWYAPFFAWVGALSTVFRRWSIPLAFLIPGLVGLLENLFFADTGPRAGYFLNFLRQRTDFSLERRDIFAAFMSDQPVNIGILLNGFFSGIDWVQMAGGLIFAALAVYVASEYRRRVIST